MSDLRTVIRGGGRPTRRPYRGRGGHRGRGHYPRRNHSRGHHFRGGISRGRAHERPSHRDDEAADAAIDEAFDGLDEVEEIESSETSDIKDSLADGNRESNVNMEITISSEDDARNVSARPRRDRPGSAGDRTRRSRRTSPSRRRERTWNRSPCRRQSPKRRGRSPQRRRPRREFTPDFRSRSPRFSRSPFARGRRFSPRSPHLRYSPPRREFSPRFSPPRITPHRRRYRSPRFSRDRFSPLPFQDREFSPRFSPRHSYERTFSPRYSQEPRFSPRRFTTEREQRSPFYNHTGSPVNPRYGDSPRSLRRNSFDREFSRSPRRFSRERSAFASPDHFSGDRYRRSFSRSRHQDDFSPISDNFDHEPAPKPLKPCLICQSVEHQAKSCPDLVCYNCQQSGHFAKECTNPTVPRVKPTGNNSESKASTGVSCFNCGKYGHQIRHCDSLVCRKCGDMGHFAKECANPPNPARVKESLAKVNMAPNEPSVSDSGQLHTVPPYTISDDRTLSEHYLDKITRSGASPLLSDTMLATWKLAGHNESSLKALCKVENPKSASQLRLALIKVLSTIPPLHLPRNIEVSDLLDYTVSYFFPDKKPEATVPAGVTVTNYKPTAPFTNDDSMRNIQSALNSISEIEKFRELDSKILGKISKSTELQDQFDGRFNTLDELRVYNVKKMETMKRMFGLSDAYIQTVSTTIQKLVAYIGESMFSLQRDFKTFGEVVLVDGLTQKLRPFSSHFPSGISVDYIVSVVGDFLKSC